MKSQEENGDVCMMTLFRLRHTLRQRIRFRIDPELNGETVVCWCNCIMYPHLRKNTVFYIAINNNR